MHIGWSLKRSSSGRTFGLHGWPRSSLKGWLRILQKIKMQYYLQRLVQVEEVHMFERLKVVLRVLFSYQKWIIGQQVLADRKADSAQDHGRLLSEES